MIRITRGRIVASAVLLLWAAVVGQHVRREYFKPTSVRLAEAAGAMAPGTHFYAVRMGGQTIGMATSRLDTVPAGFAIDEVMMLDMPALGQARRATVRSRVMLDRLLAVDSFRFELDSDAGRFAVAGRVSDGRALEVAVEAGSAVERSTIGGAGREPLLAAALPLRLAAGGELSAGRMLHVEIFDPSSLSMRQVEILVLGRDTLSVPDSVVFDDATGRWRPVTFETHAAWHLEERFGGIRVNSWIDDDGRLLRAESPVGFVMERTAYEIAWSDWERARTDPLAAAGYGAVIEATAIASDVALPDDAGPDSLVLRLLDVDLAGFDLDGGRQRLRGDTLIIVRETVAGLNPGYRLPYAAGGDPTGELAAELAATPLIQIHDERVAGIARQIAAGNDAPVAVARRLNDWVYANVAKELVLGVPSAVQVLETRRGDCNEHTVLYVALARSLGLPARTAVGVVHLRGRFYYHAWPEVWLGEWVAVDPTLGQFPAGASHLRFVVGGLARQVELLRLIGRLRLEGIS